MAIDPAWVRGLPPGALPKLAAEIRRFLVAGVAATGGHLGSNLGVVELTIALHRVFESPRDVLLFDTGHQAYVHKILTGRAPSFGSLRQAGGLSGYPLRAESAHDVIENSHASTGLSYADGLAKAFALRGERDRRVVVVVGDGALTGGLAWEALNNLGAAPHRPVMVVLNDNGRSYAPTAGALPRHLAKLRAMAGACDGPALPPRSLFEALGFAYVGPFDGHDVSTLEAGFRRAAALDRPVVVHCITQKGRGYPPAEEDEADHLHTVGAFDPASGPLTDPGLTWTDVFGAELAAIGLERPDVVAVTAAMAGPAGLGRFAARFPDRVFDVGIAEAHAVTSAAGLALGGLHPVVAIYAPFLGRAFDQLLMDVALHRLPVTIVCDRAGVTGPDGPSHHGMWDASVLPVVPGLRVAAPRDPGALRGLLREAVADGDHPTLLRYPKARAGPSTAALARVGRGDLLVRAPGAGVLLVGVGPMAGVSVGAAGILAGAGVACDVVDPRWIAPVEPDLVGLAGTYPLVVAVEDTTCVGALGGRLGQALADTGSSARVVTLALPPSFLPHASRAELLHGYGLDAGGIAAAVLDRLAR
ncbi:MAG TPA: 1-deoxy-D-xylulose-5-phosphate synthase [Actinomycetota bacterium]|nr:1-deoxy-D-xylulose-5-phosphate synthase [Actinomycetota bacterium]